MNYLNALNERQKQAVLQKDGPILIIAGAGAGKTKTLTYRILHLIKEGVSASSILAITFTNKAAKEMRDRVMKLLTEDKSLNLPVSFSEALSSKLTANSYPFVSTFHALGVHILRENARTLDIPRHFNIFDKSDSIRSVKEAILRADLDPKNFEPARITHVISKEKGNAVTRVSFETRATTYIEKIVSSVWKHYEIILKEERALDFDDLLLRTVTLLEQNPKVREHYQNVWHYLHVDEYQDTNKVQYKIVRLLSEKHKNIAVVGDGDQCLLPSTKIKTDGGDKKIIDIKKGEMVVSASGNGSTCFAKVSGIRKNKYSGDIVEIKTESGVKIRMTPEHMLFAKLSLTENLFYVYLMYRRDKGFRIGIAKSVRHDGRGNIAVGLLVRCNQEKADKIWILKVCGSKREASYWEIYLSSQYGVPTIVFLACGRKLNIEQEDIDKIFEQIDTVARVDKLFQETGLNFNHPHYFPQGTTRSNSDRDRLNINLNMFADRRKSIVHPWGMSRVSINTTDTDLRLALEKAGFKTRKGKRGDWRLEIARLDYGEVERLAQKIKNLKSNLTLIRSAFITKNKKMLFQPASNIIPGMLLGCLKGKEIVEEKVMSVRKKHYEGMVYDLNVDRLHNYIAENIVVHNCIYSWRGADIKNILDFEKDYPEAKVVLLEENYRSTKTILEVANRVIKKNKQRREKNLFTKNPDGERVGLYEAYDENDESGFVATRSKGLIENGVKPSEIAVLYRANFQGRALEEAFLNEKVPYQVLGTRFFERKEVKDVTSYLRVAIDPESIGDLKRVINVPARGIGKVTILKVLSGQESALPKAMREKIAKFRQLLSEIKNKSQTDRLSDVLRFIVKESGLEKALRDGPTEDEERLENIRELVTFATRYDNLPKEQAIEQFLTDSALASDQDELLRSEGGVKLMTVHASKGLEFDYVFVTGLEENLFPHKKAREENVSDSEAEEERRLFYVALTRARKKVFLSYASVRTIFGSKQVNVPSEFVLDVEDEFLEKEESLGVIRKIIRF